MKKTKIDHYTDKEALDFHNSRKPGKIEIISSKPMTSKRDLALAYSPGVAAPVRAIAEKNEAKLIKNKKGNVILVRVIASSIFWLSPSKPGAIKNTKIIIVKFLQKTHRKINNKQARLLKN